MAGTPRHSSCEPRTELRDPVGVLSLLRGPSPLRRRPLSVSPIVDRYYVDYE